MKQWARLIAGRLLQAAGSVVAIAALCFLAAQALPGDAAAKVMIARFGEDFSNGALADQIRAEIGLDRPVLMRFLEWLGAFARLELGRSVITGQPVANEIAYHLGSTAWLVAAAWPLSIAIALPLGTWVGTRRGAWPEAVSTIASAAIVALPPYVLASGLILVFALELGWLPVAGLESWRHVVLPAATIAIGAAARSSRIVAASLRAVYRTPAIAFARTKGLPAGWLFRWHGMRPAAGPIVAYLALQLAYVTEGAVIVETVFAYPGIGRLLVRAVLERDIPIVQGVTIFAVLVFVAANGLADLLNRRIDPRPPAVT
jgi:peptide/nickel transport system permease protein